MNTVDLGMIQGKSDVYICSVALKTGQTVNWMDFLRTRLYNRKLVFLAQDEEITILK